MSLYSSSLANELVEDYAMQQMQKLAAVLLAWLLLYSPSYATTSPMNPGTIARLSEGHGTIFKRAFIDWTKETWGEPVSAKIGDELYEGMQLGTGDKSWAQISWPNVTTRAWSNTVVAVAPNQRIVYLMGGEMLFNLKKDRKDKGDYVVWTKVLQARIRGTTVLVQSTALFSRLCVLEGIVDVMNRLDHSVVRVTPGVVFEIRNTGQGLRFSDPRTNNHQPPSKNDLPNISKLQTPPDTNDDRGMDALAGNESLPNDKVTGEKGPHESFLEAKGLPPITQKPDGLSTLKNLPAPEANIGQAGLGNAKVESASAAPLANITALSSGGEIAPLTQIIVGGRPELSLFETSNSTSRLYVADADSLSQHPLVTQFDTPLDSLPLVVSSLSKLPPVCHVNVDQGLPDNGSAVNLTSNQGTLNLGSTPSLTGLPNLNGTDKILVNSMQIMRVPTALGYKVGPLIGSQVLLPPGAFNLFTPSGIMGQQPGTNPANQIPTTNHVSGQPVIGGVSSTLIKKDGLVPNSVFMESPQGLTSPSGPASLAVYKQFNNIPSGMIRGPFNGSPTLGADLVHMHQIHHKPGFGFIDIINNFGQIVPLGKPIQDTTGGLPPLPGPNLPILGK